MLNRLRKIPLDRLFVPVRGLTKNQLSSQLKAWFTGVQAMALGLKRLIPAFDTESRQEKTLSLEPMPNWLPIAGRL